VETNLRSLKAYLATAAEAARAAGALMRQYLRKTKKVNQAAQHDIKLDLDVRSQRLITRVLAQAWPEIPILGEEDAEDSTAKAEARWVVDPIDGTVNYAYGIPHAAVSIALQVREKDGFRSVAGVVYDPFMDELWSAISGQKAKLNGKPIKVSSRSRVDEALVSLGFAQGKESLDAVQQDFLRLTHRVRKLRIMGSAALALVYVADGRFDAYIETGVRIWDVAAGGLIVEAAGGEFWNRPLAGEHRVAVVASNGKLRRQLTGHR